jgi:hypothetical protein
MKTLSRAPLVLVLALPVAAQSRLYVDGSTTTPGNGSSWSMPLRTLQEALTRATSGTEVWVATGSYAGGFTVPAGVSIHGGFRAGDLRLTQARPETNVTILDGRQLERVLQLGDRSVVEGFLIQNGNAGGAGGGGILVDGTAPTIRNCVLRDNRNSAGRGSAMLVNAGSAPVVVNCVFTSNDGPGHVIDINTAGGLYRNLVVFDNLGNGLHFQLGSNPVIQNCVFVRNTGRGVCHISATDMPVLENNLLWSNTVSLYHFQGRELATIDLVNALPYARSNITGDPQFLAPQSLDFRSAASSPLIDAGAGLAPATGPKVDVYGNSRVLDGDMDGAMRIDIGAAEHAARTLAISGPLMPGTNLMITIGGPGSLPSALWLATGATDGLLLDPLGYLRLSFAGAYVGVPWNATSGTTAVPIPSSFPGGTSLFWQLVAAGGSGGLLSNLVDTEIR